MIFEDTGEAQLKFLTTITETGDNLSEDVKIENNSISVDSTAEPGFNISANLSFYNTNSLSLTNRTPYRNGESCPASICTELVDADTYVFNVSYFTNYSVGEAPTPPTVILVSPADDYVDTDGNITFVCNATDNYGLANITLWTNISGNWEANQTNIITGTANETNFNLTNIGSGDYIWNCEAYDANGNSDFADANRTFNVSDYIDPTVELVSPADDYTDNDGALTFSCNATDNAGLENINFTRCT